jgi:hypothetical protein
VINIAWNDQSQITNHTFLPAYQRQARFPGPAFSSGRRYCRIMEVAA